LSFLDAMVATSLGDEDPMSSFDEWFKRATGSHFYTISWSQSTEW
jgi:hypothetical protein